MTPLSVLPFLIVQCLLMAHPQAAKEIEIARQIRMSFVYSLLNLLVSSATTSALAKAAGIKNGQRG